MTESQIVDSWFQYVANRDKLPCIVYDEPVYNFIESCADKREFGDKKYYKVFGVWQRIAIRKPNQPL